MNNHEQTGFPSVDQPWLKYYDEDTVHLDKHKSLYQCFRDYATEHGNQLAFIQQRTGLKLTYRELLNQTDQLAAAMKEIGVCSGSRVGVFGFYSEFEPVAILATNKIGSLVNMMSPDLNVNELRKSFEELDMLFSDGLFRDLEGIISSAAIPTVWNTKEAATWNDRYYDFEEMVSGERHEGEHHDAEECYIFSDDEPAMIIYSSGTTGAPKPIVHTNASVLSAIEVMLNSGFPINEDNYILKVIPSHIGLGCITTLLTALIGGSACITIKPTGFMTPPADTIEMVMNYKQFVAENGLDSDKGLLMFASPLFSMVVYNALRDVPDLSFLKGILLAGAKMEKEQLDEMSKAFESKGLVVPLCNGYGQNEMCGAITLNTVRYNKNGSAGYPVKGVDVRIIDDKTRLEKTYGSEGLIVERSNCGFLYYENMPERTADSFIILPDGTSWYNTNDLGYIDEDGFVFFTGRTSRVVIKMDHKISLDYIEERLRSIEAVSDAAVIAVDDSDSIQAFIVLDYSGDAADPYELIRQSGQFALWDTPEKAFIVDSLPYMKNGKIDYRKLKKAAEQNV